MNPWYVAPGMGIIMAGFVLAIFAASQPRPWPTWRAWAFTLGAAAEVLGFVVLFGLVNLRVAA